MKRRRGKEYTREVNLLKEMKGEAHDLIDEIAATGRKKWEIYILLRKRLKCEAGKEHLANMNTYEEVERAILVLDQMKKQTLSKRKPKRKKRTAPPKPHANKALDTVVSKKKLLQRQKRDDKAALLAVGREKIRKEMARAAKINATVGKYPRFLQRFVRKLLT